MYKKQMQIRDFHRACNLKAGEGPDELPIRPESWNPDEMKLRFDLIKEEVIELADAINAGNATEVVDALCDIVYVTYGFFVSIGIDSEPFEEEVHRTNMLKASGPKREDGKQLKPEGWQPPRIAQMLDQMYNHYYGAPVEDSTDQSDLKSRILSVVKDSSGPSSFVSGSEVHGLLQTEETRGRLPDS